ncbi:polyisoprenoid-binding protein YceI [Chryseobacterium sp. 52]|uniref:YceI family protein n=1 Tax=Chryseobacterium sp. 52 TaxID=2035213 RepID=UPI000C1A0D2D|nr:YceI family protein [Chryseobacterium sp. 52]PIF45863.1 polyisoprenoid-binding protein YceI [Chryseobacterium sp. 52]
MTKFSIQPESSTVNWTGKKILGLHTGTINIQSGYISFEQENLTGGEVVIDMTSIIITDIKDPKMRKDFLDHLNNDDFFSVDHFKTSKLTISNAEKIDNRYRIDGHLTIKDLTNPVSFTASVEIFTDFLHILGEIVIDRTLYHMKYGSGKFLSNLGDQLIHDEFILQFKLIGQK